MIEPLAKVNRFTYVDKIKHANSQIFEQYIPAEYKKSSKILQRLYLRTYQLAIRPRFLSIVKSNILKLRLFCRAVAIFSYQVT